MNGARSQGKPWTRCVHGWVSWAALAALMSCSEGSSEGSPAISVPSAERQGPPEGVYQRERRIEVKLELAPADWEVLRFEGRTLAHLEEEPPPPFRYTGFPAQVTVDGVLYSGVEVRKKGYIGSVSSLRPSLRLDFAPDGQELVSGLRRLTLNADYQDRSHARQCMALDLLAAAGVPASRCAFAHVIVNGVDFGTYSNVEPITGRMLRRFWSNDSGPLYEGTDVDIDADSWQSLELESNGPTDHAELRQLVAALDASDETLVSELSAILELDRFRDFWAMETLLGHWDGFAGNRNNYYLFFSPDSQRFEFIPWGLDQAFVGQRPNSPEFYHITVYARSRLTRRLYDLPEQRALFRRRLAELNDQLWSEPALLAQARAIEELVPDAAPDAMATHRAFLNAHGSALRAALAEPAPEIVDLPEPPAPSCPLPRSPIGGTFTAYWDSDDVGVAEVALSLDGMPLSASFYPAATPDMDPTRAVISLSGPLADGRSVLVLLLLPRQLLRPGSYPFHAGETLGLAASIGVDGTFNLLGLFGDGELSFSRAGTVTDAPIVGEFQGTLYQSACLGAGG